MRNGTIKFFKTLLMLIGEKIDSYPFSNGSDYVYNEIPTRPDLKTQTIIIGLSPDKICEPLHLVFYVFPK